jgi:hypothetical protein
MRRKKRLVIACDPRQSAFSVQSEDILLASTPPGFAGAILDAK